MNSKSFQVAVTIIIAVVIVSIIQNMIKDKSLPIKTDDDKLSFGDEPFLEKK